MMIQTFQRFSQSPIAKAFLILVALSFGVFFGGSQFFGSRNQNVADVGEMAISARDFSLQLEMERRALEAQTGQSISLEQMARAGRVGSVLQRLVANALLDQEANRLGLAVTDMEVLDQIHAEKAFQNEAGQFDRNIFDRILYANRMTEDSYIDEIKSELMRRQLQDAVVSGAFAPKLLSDAMLESLHQIRQGATVTLKPENMTKPANPGDEVLETFYTEQKDLFMQPELRTFTAMLITPEMAAGDMEITEDDIRAEYEATKDNYDGKAFDEVKGQVKQSIMKQLAADKIYELTQKIEDELAGGSNLEDIGRDYQVVAVEDISLSGRNKNGGDVGQLFSDEATQNQIIAEAFQTEEGLESQFLETASGEYFIVRVDKVQPSQPLEFADIKDRVYKDWVYAQQVEEAFKSAEKIIQGINSGTSSPGTLSLLPNISLSNTPKDISESVVSALYFLSPGKATMVPADDGIVVVMLKNIIPASNQVINAEQENAEKEAVELQKADLLQGYIESLKIRYQVTPNWEMVRAIVGNGS